MTHIACGVDGKCTHSFSRTPEGNKPLGIYRRTREDSFKYILEKWDVRVLTKFIWQRSWDQ